jgi:hypothetical protein
MQCVLWRLALFTASGTSESVSLESVASTCLNEGHLPPSLKLLSSDPSSRGSTGTPALFNLGRPLLLLCGAWSLDLEGVLG